MTGPAPQLGAMSADGRYALGAATQRDATEIGVGLIAAAMESVELTPTGPPLMIADFGAADGANSLGPISHVLRSLRQAVGRRPVLVVHADIVGNDFSALAATVANSPQSYTRDDADVVPMMVARSLYGTVLPSDSLTFGWTASTVHWLSKPPGPVADSFFVQMSTDTCAQAAFAAQSAADWRMFLRARAEELCVGSSVVVVDVLMDDDGVMGAENLFTALDTALAVCRDDGTISAQEYADIVYPTWFRSTAELRAPFAPTFETEAGRRLELCDLTTGHLPDPLSSLITEPQAYAAAQVDFLRGFLHPSFAAALRPERRPALDRVWTLTGELVAADSAGVTPDYRLVALRVRRTA